MLAVNVLFLKRARTTTWTSAATLRALSTIPTGFKEKKSLYELLEVPMSADQIAIKEAFFKRSKEIHPDLHPDDPDAVTRFQQLAAAYEVLSDPKTRREYDDEHERKQQRKMHSEQFGWTETERRPRYGVDPTFGRQVEVDLSPERMAKAWEAYKARWEAEEEYLKQLEQRKIKFRQEFDRARESRYAEMSEEDLLRLRQNMRAIRNSNQHYKRFSGLPKREEERAKEEDNQTEAEDEKEGKGLLGRIKGAMGEAEEVLIHGRRPDRWKSKERLEQGEEKDPFSRRQGGIRVEDNFHTDDTDPLVDKRAPKRRGNFKDLMSQMASETRDNSKKRWSNIKENWDSSNFLGDSTGSSFDSGPYRSHDMQISRVFVFALACVILCLFYVDHTYQRRPEDTNKYLAELLKQQQQEEEQRRQEAAKETGKS